MSMKRFLRSRKSDADRDSVPPLTNSSNSIPTTSSNSTNGSQNSVNDFQPMFDSGSQPVDPNDKVKTAFSFNNDLSLNLNPSISNSKPSSVFTKESEYVDQSVFSQSKKSFSTKQSSYKSSGSASSAQKKGSFNYGQPLQILNIPEENNEELKTPYEVIADKLAQLYDDLSFVMSQYNNSIINLTNAVINTIDCFKKFVAYMEKLRNPEQLDWKFTTFDSSSLRRIMKIYLNFYDNLLRDEVYIKLKLLLVKNFNDFTKTLNSRNSGQIPPTIVKPQNFAVGNNQGVALPNEDVLVRIIEKMSTTSISIKEQNGSFIAPITRGISKDLNILCLYFGYPDPTDYHYKLTQSLHELYDDIHVIVSKNQIELAASGGSTATDNTPVSKLTNFSSYHHGTSSGSAAATTSMSEQTITPPVTQKFKLPFRIPTDPLRPPMSLSLSVENSSRTSGTMGGYIYPIIDTKKQPHLESYANSKFAISCGHVCLDNTNITTTEYPHVSAPSSVLISLYKSAVLAQYQKVVNRTDELMIAESKVAYGAVLHQLEEMFPLKRVKILDPKDSQGKDRYETRNLPKNRFGQIIWGERTLINIKKEDSDKDRRHDSDVEKRLSDLAIIKVNKNLICDQNYLGDDIAFNEFDPALMFDNLYVRSVINLTRYSPKTLDLNIDEVDSSLSTNSTAAGNNYNGLSVFKYGSTSKFTKGTLNGIKLVYWLDGAIHSSEFIVNSLENNSAFASGGDSGSWILTKLEDIEGSPYDKGLGVVGMLHSYDGEFKQFGLFTPMCEILQRLEEVTSIKWGVVGCSPQKDTGSESDVDDEATTTEEEDDDIDGEDERDDSEYESGVEELDGAVPPEID
ncbi:peptidase S64 [Scheffersomyces xylosifermentans]|uniref:peptidase S64 n=1 Tax=Scheffersomyces xylosifermentans TaxID=1304137 RepID=UPI00315CBD83